MRQNTKVSTEKNMEVFIGYILRSGVIASAAAVLTGGIIYLAKNMHTAVSYHTFSAAAAYPHNLAGIFAKAASFDGYGIIQLGVLVLIATPIMRVLFSVAAFAKQKDFKYAVFTLAVLVILVYSLVWR